VPLSATIGITKRLAFLSWRRLLRNRAT